MLKQAKSIHPTFGARSSRSRQTMESTLITMAHSQSTQTCPQSTAASKVVAISSHRVAHEWFLGLIPHPLVSRSKLRDNAKCMFTSCRFFCVFTSCRCSNRQIGTSRMCGTHDQTCKGVRFFFSISTLACHRLWRFRSLSTAMAWAKDCWVPGQDDELGM